MSIAKKIAVVTPVFPPYRGGMGTVAFHHARLLAERGQGVTVFTPSYVRQGRTSEGKPDYGFRLELLKPIFKYGNAAWVPQLEKKLKDFDAVILEYPFFGGMRAVYRAKKKFGFKLILYYHMDVIVRGLKGLVFLYTTKYFLPRIIQSTDTVLASSEDYARHSHLGSYWQEGNERFCIVPHGVDVQKYNAGETDESFRKNLNLAADERVVLFVGGLDAAHYFKGVEYLIRAIPHIRSGAFKAIIAGRGEMQAQYKKLAEALGVRSKLLFTGGVSDEMLVKLYQLAAITVLPSIDQSESFGIVLAESLSCGTPVISTDLPGVRSVYENGVSGITVPVRDERALAVAISDILNNSARAKEMGRAGRKLVENKYSWNTIGDTLLSLCGV